MPDAQANYAICLAEGRGVEKDFVEALKLCILAASSGLERASHVQEMLKSRMSQQDIQKAMLQAGAK
jgi:TPR repeat protein